MNDKALAAVAAFLLLSIAVGGFFGYAFGFLSFGIFMLVVAYMVG